MLWILAPVLAFVALVCWGISSPVGSSPDDDFHLPSIWCGLGDRGGLCEPTGDPDTRLVPASIVGEACFARDSTESGACWDAGSSELAETDRVNTEPLYPPLFYGAMSVFASEDVVASVLVMRIVNSALFVGFVTAVAWALPAAVRRTAVVPFVVTVVPLGMFIVPSTNASSWALLSAGTLWVALFGATKTRGRRRWTLLGLAIVAALLGAGARADAAAYGVLAVMVVVILTARRRRELVPVYAVAAAIVAICVVFFFWGRQSAAATSGLPTDGGTLTAWQHVDNLLEIPSLWTGMFGGWGLGWFDTPLPASVSVLVFAVFVMAAALGLRVLTLRKTLAALLVFAALWLVPFVLLWQSRALVGTHVQPRYILPLAVLLVGVLLLGVRDVGGRAARGPALTGIAMLVFANAVALHVELNRYTLGLDRKTFVPGKDAEWWWSSSPVWPVWAIGVLAFAGALVALYLATVTRGRERALPR